jgi:prepilin-type N-terminal cleavage/methylation domain-containing protein
MTPTREEILKILRDNKERFAEKYGVTKLGLFGSFARDEATKDSGFTLLEILLTMSILLIGFTFVFHTAMSAMQRMAMARELAEAQNACRTVLNELLAGSALIEPDEGKIVEHLPNWRIQVEIYPASQSGLAVLHLSAFRASHVAGLPDSKYQLIRWIPSERVRFPEQQQPSNL